MTARERLREQRALHTSWGDALHVSPQRRPLVVYRCSAEVSGGRSGCLLLEVFDTPDGALLYKPASKVRASVADRNAREQQMPAMGALLDDVLEDAVGDLLAGLAVCRHYVEDISAERLAQDVQQARRSRQQVRRSTPDGESPLSLVGRR